MVHPALRCLVPSGLAILGLAPAGRASDVPESLREALLEELPTELRTAGLAALEADSPEGSFRVELGEMDGAAPQEAVLVYARREKPARIVFVADAGNKVVREGVKLPGGKTAGASVSFHDYAEGKRLAQVQGRSAGGVLLGWDGRKLQVVWSSGKPRPQESRWFELEDLDADGVREIVTYVRRAIDVAADDEVGETGPGGSAGEETAPVSVLAWDGERWRKNEKLLDGRR